MSPTERLGEKSKKNEPMDRKELMRMFNSPNRLGTMSTSDDEGNLHAGFLNAAIRKPHRKVPQRKPEKGFNDPPWESELRRQYANQ